MDLDAVNQHGSYNDGHRAFMQGFIARGQLSAEEGRKLLASIFSAQEGETVTLDEVTQEDFDSYLSAATNALSPFDYDIRNTQDQITKERLYAIVNSISDPLTQMATTRTTEEILYIKRLLDAMFETHNTRRREVMAITSLQALEKNVLKGSNRASSGEAIASVDKGLTGAEAERLLKKLEQEKWLERSKEGFYRLSPRSLMELRGWLDEAYNFEPEEGQADEWQRIKSCEACKEIITIGQRCANLDCNCRLHDICAEAYWVSRPSQHCPRCQTEWDGEHYVGQKCITTTDDYLRDKRRSGGVAEARRNREVKAGSNRGRSRRAEEEDVEEEEEEEAEDYEEEAAEGEGE